MLVLNRGYVICILYAIMNRGSMDIVYPRQLHVFPLMVFMRHLQKVILKTHPIMIKCFHSLWHAFLNWLEYKTQEFQDTVWFCIANRSIFGTLSIIIKQWLSQQWILHRILHRTFHVQDKLNSLYQRVSATCTLIHINSEVTPQRITCVLIYRICTMKKVFTWEYFPKVPMHLPCVY